MQRQHRLRPFADTEPIVRLADPNPVTEQFAHGLARQIDRRLAAVVGSSQVQWTPVIAPPRAVT